MFREFLRCEYSEENILFWLACEDLKKENNPEKIEEKARMIYEDYVSILSPREVGDIYSWILQRSLLFLKTHWHSCFYIDSCQHLDKTRVSRICSRYCVSVICLSAKLKSKYCFQKSRTIEGMHANA